MAADKNDGALPSIRASRDERPQAVNNDSSTGMRAVVREQRVPASTGALWALTAALSLALLGLGYWSYQQQDALRQQLIATQDSFARISEDAAGQIELITGQVSATESQLSAAEQAQRDQLADLEEQVAQQREQIAGLVASEEQQEDRLAALQQALESAISDAAEARQAAATTQAEQLAELSTELQANSAGSAALQTQLADLEQQLASMQEWSEQLSRLHSQQRTQADEIERLASRDAPDVAAAEEAILALSTRLDREQEESAEVQRAIDSFRVQVTRNINTLQSQVAALQQQLDGR
ncbi:MAG: hypothetical protein EA348_10370 [Pseudomonadaceae bacterium]|nr:MAG: hypothetical protein EA348_10370 [Pseudomonadaceae bacterium]